MPRRKGRRIRTAIRSTTLTFVRRQVLQLIVKNDEALGFDLFFKRRLHPVSDALAERPLPDYGRLGFSIDDATPAKGFIRQENELEQSLALTVIATDPQKAIEILRRSDPETITYVTCPLLKALRQ